MAKKFTEVTIGPCRMILGDSIDVLETIDDESCDAMVTDPPFGIGYNYDGLLEKTKDPIAYWNTFLKPIHAKLVAKVKPGGFKAVWQTQLYDKYFHEWFGDDIHVYVSCKNFVQLHKTPINYGYDPIPMSYKEGAKPLIPREKQKRSLDYFVADTAHFGGRDHPCPRPLDQVNEILRNFTIEGALVIDGFMGWATVGIACMKTGRRYIGIEKRKLYFESAVERVKFEWNGLNSKKSSLDGFAGKV